MYKEIFKALLSVSEKINSIDLDEYEEKYRVKLLHLCHHIIHDNLNSSKLDDFQKAVNPAIKYLCENHHPHTVIIITQTSAELFEGVKRINETKYLKD